MEDCKVTLHQLCVLVREWGIVSRISQKVSIWNIRYSQQKINRVPEHFLQKAFVFYVLKKHPELISNYSQQQLMIASLSLKNVYSVDFVKYFRLTKNFNFTLVVLSKVLKYFLLYYFTRTSFQEDIESDIYSCIIQALLGYPVNTNAYHVLEKNLKKKNKHARESIDLPDTHITVEKLEKTARSQKKIPRKAEFDLFSSHAPEKRHVDIFRLQIHDALRVKRTLPSRKEAKRTKQISLVKNSGTKSVESSDWQRNNFSRLNLHQISSAMAIQPGFDKFRRSTGIQLSKKRQLRQSFAPSEHEVAKQHVVNKPVESRQTHQDQSKSWSLIIQQMRSHNKENKYSTATTTPLIVPPPMSAIKIQQPESQRFLRHTTINFDMNPVTFKAVRPDDRVKMECSSSIAVLREVKSPIKEGKMVSFVQQLNKFESKCKERRKNIETNSGIKPPPIYG